MHDDGVTRAFLEFKQGLKKIVRRFVDNPVDVEDIVHEAYVRSLKASRSQKIDAPKAFIAKAARNLALNHVTSARVALNENIGDADFPDARWGDNGVEQAAEAQRNLHAYCQAIEALPRQARRVYTLKQVYGLSQKEISAKLGISEKTVEYHVSKGLLHCRRYLKSIQPEIDKGVATKEVREHRS
mgnify:CR=1 FL=1